MVCLTPSRSLPLLPLLSACSLCPVQANEAQKKAAKRRQEALQFYGIVAAFTTVRATPSLTPACPLPLSRIPSTILFLPLPAPGPSPPQLVYLAVRWYRQGDSWSVWHYGGLLLTSLAYLVAIYGLASGAEAGIEAKSVGPCVVWFVCVLPSPLRLPP